MQRIIRTFAVAVPAMANVLCFLGLVFFVYTVTSHRCLLPLMQCIKTRTPSLQVVGQALFSSIRRTGIYFLHAGMLYFWCHLWPTCAS